MTDDGRDLSRRERRAQEEREATNVPADTDALALGPISESIPTHAPDGRMLSRRERRRLERARQPMETWTAEEEMIATGQIPAMTPERIAEQEQLARERAATAQREAQEASAELEGLAGHPAVAQSAAAPVAQSAPEAGAQQPWAPVTEPSVPASEHPQSVPSAPAAEPEPESGPERTSLIAAVAAEAAPPAPAAESPASAPEQSAPSASSAPATNEPASFEPAAFEPAPSAASPTTSAVIHPVPSAVTPAEPAGSEPAAYEPHVGEESATETDWSETNESDVAEPVEDSAPEAHAPAPAAAVPGMPPGMTPEMFAALFPPGSLQRRLMEDQAAEEAALASKPEPQAEDPAAEIRRLAQEAVAGIDATGGWSPDVPEVHQEDAPQENVAPSADFPPSADAAPSAEQPAAWGAPAPASQSAPDYYSQPSSPSAPTTGMPDTSPPTFSIPTLDGDAQPQSADPSPTGFDPEPVASPSAQPAEDPHEPAPFDAVFGDHPGSAALDEVSGTPAEYDASRFDDAGVNSAPSAEPVTPGFTPAPTSAAPWGEHPLSQVDREAPELPEMPPAQVVAQPDLSGVGFSPQPSPRGPVPIVEPVPTGQIEVPPRARPELTGADVPRHFKWAHLAVFGAVGLLLGVVVWQVL